MRNYGTAGSTRTYERELVASEYPSIQVYRRPITLYETEKAKAGKFFYGGSNARNFGFPEGASWMDYHLMYKSTSSPSANANAVPNSMDSTKPKGLAFAGVVIFGIGLIAVSKFLENVS